MMFFTTINILFRDLAGLVATAREWGGSQALGPHHSSLNPGLGSGLGLPQSLSATRPTPMKYIFT